MSFHLTTSAVTAKIQLLQLTKPKYYLEDPTGLTFAEAAFELTKELEDAQSRLKKIAEESTQRTEKRNAAFLSPTVIKTEATSSSSSSASKKQRT